MMGACRSFVEAIPDIDVLVDAIRAEVVVDAKIAAENVADVTEEKALA